MPWITEVYSSNPTDYLWCHIPLLEWQQRKTFQQLSRQEGQKMKMVLHPVSVSSMGNTCLPFLLTVGYVPCNTMAHGQECCLCWQREGALFFLPPWMLQWVNGLSLLRSPVLSSHGYWPPGLVLLDGIFCVIVMAAVCIGITMQG